MTGKNATPLIGWHPRADLVAWLEAEVERRGGGRGVQSEILNEALAALSGMAVTQSPETTGETK